MISRVIKKTVDLDAVQKVDQLDGSLYQLEESGHTFEITCLSNGAAAAVSGTVSGRFLRADGVTQLISGTLSGNVVSITLTQNCYNVPGRFGLVVYVTGSDVSTAIYCAVGSVYRSTSDTVVDSGSIIPTPEQLEAMIEACGAATTAATAAAAFVPNMIAPAFDASVANAAGDYVTNSGKLYRITADRAANVTWSNTTKVEVTAGAGMKYGIDSLKVSGEALENASQAYTGDRWLDFRYGRWAGNTIGTATEFVEHITYVCAMCPCVKGDKFLIDVYGKSTTVNRTIVILDSDKNVLWRSSTAHITGVYTVPTDQTWSDSAAYICFNNLLESQPSGYYAIKCSSTLIEKLAAKQDTLTFDNDPTEGSANPVKSGGVYSSIAEVNGKMATLETAIGGYEAQIPAGAESGYYWNNETNTAVKTAYSSYRAYAPISCSPGEVYRVLGYEATSQKQQMVLVVDEDYTILVAYGGHTQTVKEYEFTVPSGGAYILMTTITGHTVKCYERHLNSIPGGVYGGMFPYADANVAIIGDSISTNGNWSDENPFGNVPEIVVEEEDVGVELSAYVTYYDVGTTIGGHTITESDVGTELTFTPTAEDVGKVIGKPLNNNSESVVTWWEVARDTLGFNVIPVCWSGSSITDHEINAQDNGHYIYKCSNAFHPSQIRKCGIRTPGTMTRTAPDMVIIYRGTNDFSHSPYTRLNYDLTAYQPSGYPTEDTYSDSGTTRYDYVAGMLMTIKAVRDAYPSAKVVLCTLNYFKRLSSSVPGFPTRNGQNTLEQYNDTIRAIANYANCDLIDFAKDGITAWNAGDGYYDTVNNPTHPTTKGHKVMGNRAIRDLMNINGLT